MLQPPETQKIICKMTTNPEVSELEFHLLAFLLRFVVILGEKVVEVLQSVVVCQESLVHNSQVVRLLFSSCQALVRAIQLFSKLGVVLLQNILLKKNIDPGLTGNISVNHKYRTTHIKGTKTTGSIANPDRTG